MRWRRANYRPAGRQVGDQLGRDRGGAAAGPHGKDQGVGRRLHLRNAVASLKGKKVKVGETASRRFRRHLVFQDAFAYAEQNNVRAMV